jgi:hypothetical protein
MTKYIYSWGNNPKRAELKGHECFVLKRLSMNSALVVFTNGQREVISRNALRLVKSPRTKDGATSTTVQNRGKQPNSGLFRGFMWDCMP